MRPAAAAFAITALAVALFATPVAGQDPAPLPRPDAIEQPVEDGCHRDPVGLLTFTSPEWVYVYSDETFNPDPTAARVMEATATSADVAAGDLPQNHTWYDFNADALVDPDYEYLAAGDLGDPDADPPIPPTGNLAESGGEPVVHIEWELGTLPTYAWPSAGDRLKVWGSWVWDCGHWGQGFTSDPNDPEGTVVNDLDYFLPGTNQTGGLRGEGTEFHPWQGGVITRENPYEPAVQETQTDVFISTDATTAYSEAACALKHPAPEVPAGLPPLPYPPAWTACVADAANAHQPANDRDYTFFVPAPPQPDPDADLRYRVVEHDAPGDGPEEQVTVLDDGIEVTVPFKGFGGPNERLSFAKSFYVGWSGEIQYRPAHLEVDVKRLTVNNSLDGPDFHTSAGVPPGEWGLYLDVNGYWKFLNEWAPGLDAVNDGQAFDLDRTLDIYVPDGETLRVEVDGRECDLPRIKPCPITSEVAEDNDVPGTAIDDWPSATDSLGDHTLAPDGDDPRYDLTYAVREISPARLGPPDGACVDTFPPISRIGPHGTRRPAGLPHGVSAPGDGIVLRGRSRDETCGEPGGQSTEAALAHRLGHGQCSFAGPRGTLGHPRPCAERRFLEARDRRRTDAEGRKRWRLRLSGPYPPGRYVAYSRATDEAGNVEAPLRERNRARFVLG